MQAEVARPDVLVVGAGVIGSSVAWRCAQRGLSVTVVDPEPTRGAWHTAAGMLAPVTELHYTETPLLRLNLDSLARWAGFAAELEHESALSTGFRETGTVVVAWDSADLTALHDLHAFSQRLGIESSLLTGRELRALEPAVAAGLTGGLLAPGDHQVDPRLLRAALVEAGQRRGVRVLSDEVVRIQGRKATLADGTALSAGTVVLAAGSWSAALGGPAAPPVRPVKGQTLRVRLPGPPRLDHVLRGRVKGSPVYVVPRADGQLVVGASTEEAGFDRTPRAGAVYELLRDAQSLFPELGEASLEEVCTGLRPGSPDNAPLIGRTDVDGFVHATGHYRNGVLLTPVTAYGIAALIADGALPEVLAPFSPARFTQVPA